MTPASYYHALLHGPSGPLGGSVDFYNSVGGTGNHPYIDLPTSSVFASTPPNECTVQGWMKQLHTYAGYGPLIAFDSINFMLTFTPSGGVFQLFSTLNSTFNATGGWDHITYVRSVAGGFQKFYVNGSLHDTIASSTLPRTMSGNTRRIGGDAGGDSFQGLIGDVRVWNIARNATDIAADYNVRLTGSESGLIGYWRMDEGTGVTVADSTSNANTGTFNGTSLGVAGTNSPTWSADSPI